MNGPGASIQEAAIAMAAPTARERELMALLDREEKLAVAWMCLARIAKAKQDLASAVRGAVSGQEGRRWRR